MPRSARIVIPEIPYHITQRGVNRQDVFLTDDERRLYLSLLRRFADAQGLQVLGYCLMSNHVHLAGVPRREPSLARVVGFTHLRYAQLTNPLHHRFGHLWQARFYACPLGETHLTRALRYIERNPVRAGMVATPWKYPWSSAAAHCGGSDPSGLLDLSAWRTRWPDDTLQRYLLEDDTDDDLLLLRRRTSTGRPLGDETFIEHLEAQLGRRVLPLRVGRPRKGESG